MHPPFSILISIIFTCVYVFSIYNALTACKIFSFKKWSPPLGTDMYSYERTELFHITIAIISRDIPITRLGCVAHAHARSVKLSAGPQTLQASINVLRPPAGSGSQPARLLLRPAGGFRSSSASDWQCTATRVTRNQPYAMRVQIWPWWRPLARICRTS